MKKTIFILLSTILIGCSSDETRDNNTTNGTPPNSTNENNEANGHNNLSTSENKPSYNGYNPKDDIELKFFKAISDYSTWNSFVSNFTYFEDLKNEDDIPLEFSTNSRFVLNPYQLHEHYHSVYFRNDNIEVYATEHEAYENHHFTFWTKVEDHTVYIKNPLPARTDLYYALISGSEGVVEEGPSKISFNIAQENWDALYEKVQFAYFHHLVNETTASTDGIEDLLENLNGMEGFYVEMTLKEDKISKISIAISFNRTDVETVDQLIFHEEFSEINEFNTIDIPAEVFEEASENGE